MIMIGFWKLVLHSIVPFRMPVGRLVAGQGNRSRVEWNTNGRIPARGRLARKPRLNVSQNPLPLLQGARRERLVHQLGDGGR